MATIATSPTEHAAVDEVVAAYVRAIVRKNEAAAALAAAEANEQAWLRAALAVGAAVS